MNSYSKRIIHGQTSQIKIPQNSPTSKKEEFVNKEYSLHNSFFDPSKSSPPNEFLVKLHLRMKHYESFRNFESLISE